MLGCAIGEHSEIIGNAETNCPREFISQLLRMIVVCVVLMIYIRKLLFDYIYYDIGE